MGVVGLLGYGWVQLGMMYKGKKKVGALIFFTSFHGQRREALLVLIEVSLTLHRTTYLHSQTFTPILILQNVTLRQRRGHVFL